MPNRTPDPAKLTTFGLMGAERRLKLKSTLTETERNYPDAVRRELRKRGR